MPKKRVKRTVKAQRAVDFLGKDRNVNWVVTLIMSIFFGWLGVDRFIMGHVGLGILKLITFGGCGIWWIVDIILIASKYDFKNINWVEN